MDVIEGRGPSPVLVHLLIQRLPDTSLTVALASGGREHFGWGVDRHLAADHYDALNQNTRATGNWKDGKAPTLPSYPRPKEASAPKEKRRVTVADLWKRMSGRQQGGG